MSHGVCWALMLLLWIIAGAAPAALVWEEGAGFRSAALKPVGEESNRLVPMPAGRTGVTFVNPLPEFRGVTNQIYYSGSGVAAGDVTGDGLPDLYFCGLEGGNALYRNLGEWRFEETPALGDAACQGQSSTGAGLADVDGDRDLDLLVSSVGGGVRLFQNDGQGRFTEITDAWGLRGRQASMTMALSDVDGDGDLDLYVANYRSSTVQDEVNVTFEIKELQGERRVVAVEGRPTSAPDLAHRFAVDPRGTVVELGEEDDFYLNDRGRRFVRVEWTGGMFLNEQGRPLSEPPRDWGLSAMFRDMDGNGSPDLYVCNDGESPDRIWRNDGLGHFRAWTHTGLRETSLSSMGVDFADVDRDGRDDFFVADMLPWEHGALHTQMASRRPMDQIADPGQRPAFPRNTLFWNRGDGDYAELAQWAGVDASDWSWAVAFLDVDLDGYEDLLITTGLEKNLREADGRRLIAQLRRSRQLSAEEFFRIRRELPSLSTPNHAFRNLGGLRFEPAGGRWGFESSQTSHGMALADLDEDGDLDVVVACLNAPPLLYRNDAREPRLAVRLSGLAANRHGVGARIEVEGGPVAQSQEMIAGGRYLSSDQQMRTFACGTSRRLLVRVSWRRGGTTELRDLMPNRLYEIDEPEPYLGPPHAKPAEKQRALFADVSALLDHTQVDVAHPDFQRQPMLTRRLSLASPGISWVDWNLDEFPDLIVSPGRGGELTVLAGDGRGFRHLSIQAFAGRAIDDIGSVLVWPISEGTNLCFFSQSSYESDNAKPLFGFSVAHENVKRLDEVPGWGVDVLSLAASDWDGDGDLDLFAAGRCLPGRYPVAVSSRFLRNEGNRFVADEEWSAPFSKLGLVNMAIFTDLDGDGGPELVLALDWGPLRVFRRTSAGVVEATQALGLDRFTGWWHGLAAGDFDGDNRLDLVAGNWGLNHRYRRFGSDPIQVFHADLDGDGTEELFEAYRDPALNKVVPARGWDALSARLPFLHESIDSFRQFSSMGVEEVLGAHASSFRTLATTTTQSTLFLNRGDHFEPMPLPDEAQWAPVFGVVVADFNNDSREDLFLTQNFSGPDRESSWAMAGAGLILLGEGRGHFRPLPPQESGVWVRGDGRGAAVADYDADGRVDLAAGQRGGPTLLWRNVAAESGVRVRLVGPPENRAAIGACMWAIDSEGKRGPVRELRAGSGWLSLDSFVQVLGPATRVASVGVRWPGGVETESAVNGGEVIIHAPRGGGGGAEAD